MRTVSGGAVHELLEEGGDVGDRVGVQHPLEVGAVEVDGEVAEHPDHRRRLVADAPVAAEDEDGVAAVAHELLEPSLAALLVELLGLHERVEGERRLRAEDGEALVDLVGHALARWPPRAPSAAAMRQGIGASTTSAPVPSSSRTGRSPMRSTCCSAPSTVESARSIGPVRADELGGVDRAALVDRDPRDVAEARRRRAGGRRR